MMISGKVMHNSILKYSIFFFVLLLLSFAPHAAYSCSCVYDNALEDHIQDADVIFVGTVISSKFKLRIFSPSYRRVILSVSEVFKGIQASKIPINTDSIWSGGCGYDFKEGRKYLVYAYTIDTTSNKLYTSLCARNREILEVGDDVKGELDFLRSYSEPDESK